MQQRDWKIIWNLGQAIMHHQPLLRIHSGVSGVHWIAKSHAFLYHHHHHYHVALFPALSQTFPYHYIIPYIATKSCLMNSYLMFLVVICQVYSFMTHLASLGSHFVWTKNLNLLCPNLQTHGQPLLWLQIWLSFSTEKRLNQLELRIKLSNF